MRVSRGEITDKMWCGVCAHVVHTSPVVHMYIRSNGVGVYVYSTGIGVRPDVKST